MSKYLGICEGFLDNSGFKYSVASPNIDGTGTVVMLIDREVPERFVVPDVAYCGGVKYKVVGVVPTWFNYIANMKELVIGSNIVEIYDNSFAGCTNLVSVTGGSGLVSIGTNAFAYCSNLKTFNITSKKLKKIGASAFSGDKLLTTLQFKKTTKLTKSGVKNSLKGSSVKTVKVKKSKVKKYKKIFTKKNCGRKVKVKK